MGIEWKIDLHFDDIADAVEEALPGILTRGVETLKAATTPKVPVETGSLAGSGETGLGDVMGGVMGPQADHVAHLYYPGPYALYQHEGIYFRRPAHFGKILSHEHGENFFLITTVAQESEAIVSQMGDEIKGLL